MKKLLFLVLVLYSAVGNAQTVPWSRISGSTAGIRAATLANYSTNSGAFINGDNIQTFADKVNYKITALEAGSGGGTTTNSLTPGYALSGSAFNGSVARMFAVDTTLISTKTYNSTTYLPLSGGTMSGRINWTGVDGGLYATGVYGTTRLFFTQTGWDLHTTDTLGYEHSFSDGVGGTAFGVDGSSDPNFRGLTGSSVFTLLDDRDYVQKKYVDDAITGVGSGLPSQTGNSGKYLTTNGSAASWGTISFPYISNALFSGNMIVGSVGNIASPVTPSGDIGLSNSGVFTLPNIVTGATKTKITYNAKGQVTAGADATTSDIAEGTNLYYTTARFNTAFSGKSTTDLAEGTNLYFTNARGIGSTLAGWTSGPGTVSSADDIKSALQKINGNQVADAANIATNTTNITANTNAITLTQQSHTSGTTVTISSASGPVWLIINPASVLASVTVTMPAAPVDGQRVEISFGGTMTTGTVVTALTISPNTSQALIEASSATTAEAGEMISYRWKSSNSKWYRIN